MSDEHPTYVPPAGGGVADPIPCKVCGVALPDRKHGFFVNSFTGEGAVTYVRVCGMSCLGWYAMGKLVKQRRKYRGEKDRLTGELRQRDDHIRRQDELIRELTDRQRDRDDHTRITDTQPS